MTYQDHLLALQAIQQNPTESDSVRVLARILRETIESEEQEEERPEPPVDEQIQRLQRDKAELAQAYAAAENRANALQAELLNLQKQQNMSFYVLRLNDMRMGKIEHAALVCKAATPEELIQFLNEEKVEPYIDERESRRWGKSFRKGGPLEWFNPPQEDFRQGVCPVGGEIPTIQQLREMRHEEK